MRTTPIHISVLIALLAGTMASSAAAPWPAETNVAAVNLTAVDAGFNVVNWPRRPIPRNWS